MTPARYFWIMLTVRESRLPRSLARSLFRRLTRMPSPKGLSALRVASRSMAYRMASTGYAATSCSGSMALPSDLPILRPSSARMWLWTTRRRYSGSPAARSMVGQNTACGLRMSLPITCQNAPLTSAPTPRLTSGVR